MKRAHTWIFIALTAVYIGLALVLPVDPATTQKYQLSEIGVKLLSLTILLPMVAIYFVALYGFIGFKSYADTIKKTKEGPAFTLLANGLMFLAFGLPISGVSSSILNYMARTNSDLLPATTITKNYIALTLSFIALLLIARGAELLVGTLKRQEPAKWTSLGLVATIVLSSLFTWLITTRPQGDESRAVYFLPNWLILFTLAVPYLYIWCRGIKAAYYLYVYKSKVKGVIYKNALDNAAKGIMAIITFSILIQLLVTLSNRLDRLNLTPVLFIIYALVVLYAAGYIMVAKGAKKLKRIEEV